MTVLYDRQLKLIERVAFALQFVVDDIGIAVRRVQVERKQGDVNALDTLADLFMLRYGGQVLERLQADTKRNRSKQGCWQRCKVP